MAHGRDRFWRPAIRAAKRANDRQNYMVISTVQSRNAPARADVFRPCTDFAFGAYGFIVQMFVCGVSGPVDVLLPLPTEPLPPVPALLPPDASSPAFITYLWSRRPGDTARDQPDARCTSRRRARLL